MFHTIAIQPSFLILYVLIQSLFLGIGVRLAKEEKILFLCSVSLFNDISTFVGYPVPKPFL